MTSIAPIFTFLCYVFIIYAHWQFLLNLLKLPYDKMFVNFIDKICNLRLLYILSISVLSILNLFHALLLQVFAWSPHFLITWLLSFNLSLLLFLSVLWISFSSTTIHLPYWFSSALQWILYHVSHYLKQFGQHLTFINKRNISLFKTWTSTLKINIWLS